MPSHKMDEAEQECSDYDGWSLVAPEEIESVLLMLSNNLPASLQMYNFIKCSLLWSTHYPHVKTSVFRKLSNGMESIIASSKTHENIVTVYSPDVTDMDIASVLSGNSIINWNEGPVLLSCIPKELYHTVEEELLLSGKNYNSKTFNSFWLPAVSAKNINVQCPEDMYFSKLEPSHAATVNHHWPYARETSLNLITQMINAHDTVGIFTKKDSVLVSWVLNTFYGVGMLHTIEEYRRKGYGTLVVQQLVKSLGNKGISSTILTLPVNHIAEAIFMNIGFKQLEQVVFVRAM